MSRTLVKKKARTIILGSLSGNPWGDVVGVFPEDQRSKYSKTNDSGACEDFGRGTDEVRIYASSSPEHAKCLQQPVLPGGHPSKY